MNQPRNSQSAVAFVVSLAGATSLSQMTEAKVTRPGSHEQGKGARGLPRNLGGPNCSIGKLWYRVARELNSERPRPAMILSFGSFAGDTNKKRERWYRQAKETKRDGMAQGCLSTVIVPVTAANPTRGEPEEERAVSGLWNCCWATQGIH